MGKYIMALDQGTTSSRCILYDKKGRIISSAQKEFTQIYPKAGWVEHDAMEIWSTQMGVAQEALLKINGTYEDIEAIGITNQRETTVVWDKKTGVPIYNAIVWQCRRTAEYCDSLKEQGLSEKIREKTGLLIDAYFSGTKLKWILDNVPGAREKAEKGDLLFGTIETWLIWKLTDGKVHVTDYSNASRTQLFNISTLQWDEELCRIFGIPMGCLGEVTDSDGFFGETDFEGVLPKKVPIHGVMGDSHGALFGQGCRKPGMMKATYGTGSSIMMNIGESPIFSDQGIVTSLAWKTSGKVQYVLEGNINYTGAVITWLKDDMHLLQSAGESEQMAREADPADHAYIVPAFSGLGAPYWQANAEAAIIGMRRTTGQKEIVKAGLSAIAYQITDVVRLMQQDADLPDVELRVDGGPTRNSWLMQFQSDITNAVLRVPQVEELSAIGAAYAAGLSIGLYDEDIFNKTIYQTFHPQMEQQERNTLYQGWLDAVKRVL